MEESTKGWLYGKGKEPHKPRGHKYSKERDADGFHSRRASGLPFQQMLKIRMVRKPKHRLKDKPKQNELARWNRKDTGYSKSICVATEKGSGE